MKSLPPPVVKASCKEQKIYGYEFILTKKSHLQISSPPQVYIKMSIVLDVIIIYNQQLMWGFRSRDSA